MDSRTVAIAWRGFQGRSSVITGDLELYRKMISLKESYPAPTPCFCRFVASLVNRNEERRSTRGD